MRVQNQDFDVIHFPGKQNVTDFCHDTTAIQRVRCKRAERQVKAIVKVDHAVVLDKTEEKPRKTQS